MKYVFVPKQISDQQRQTIDGFAHVGGAQSQIDFTTDAPNQVGAAGRKSILGHPVRQDKLVRS